MSTTNGEKRKIAKRIARRKAYEKQRNIAKGKRKKGQIDSGLAFAKKHGVNFPQSQLKPGEDPVEIYKRMKAEEAQKQRSEKWGKVVNFCKNLFRGKQRGA